MNLFNYIFENDVMFYGMFSATVGLIGFSFVKAYVNSYYVDNGVQTDAWEDYSERASQLASNSLTSIDTVTPRISPTSEAGTSTISGDVSTVTTVLPIPPVNIEVIPNPDIQIVSDMNTVYLSKIHEISHLYSTEINNNIMTDSDLTYLIKSFTVEQISSSNFNEIILLLINCFNG